MPVQRSSARSGAQPCPRRVAADAGGAVGNGRGSEPVRRRRSGFRILAAAHPSRPGSAVSRLRSFGERGAAAPGQGRRFVPVRNSKGSETRAWAPVGFRNVVDHRRRFEAMATRRTGRGRAWARVDRFVRKSNSAGWIRSRMPARAPGVARNRFETRRVDPRDPSYSTRHDVVMGSWRVAKLTGSGRGPNASVQPDVGDRAPRLPRFEIRTMVDEGMKCGSKEPRLPDRRS